MSRIISNQSSPAVGQSAGANGRLGPIPAGATIALDSISKWYGDVVAVSNLSFHVEPGVTALLGPNGAGKSTIIKVITGLIRPSTGRVTLLGQPVRGNVGIYKRLGLVPEQEAIYPHLTGREFVRLNAALQRLADPDQATDRAIATVELQDAADRVVGGYSKGMRQRIKIAAALVHDPDILILDEPLTGTDPVQRLHMIDLFRRLGDAGKTVLVSSHVLHEVERFSDRILVIVAGRLAAAGDYHAIRDKIDERARLVQVRSNQTRALGAALLQAGGIRGLTVKDDSLTLETDDIRSLYRLVPRLAQQNGIRLYEIVALDESLSSVFAYVTERRRS